MFSKIEKLISDVDKHKNSLFDKEVSKRRGGFHKTVENNYNILEHISCLIAYSQQANSARVYEVINNGSLKEALGDYIIDDVVNLNPCNVVDEHWDSIMGIRQKTKIFQIVMLARKLKSNEDISETLFKSKIPKELYSTEDIDQFWKEFAILKKHIKECEYPFIRGTTTLLHFLMTLGYNCVKPDSAVMKTAKELGIVTKVTGEKNLRKVVKTLQEYSIYNKRNIPPAVLDLYFLIHGGQADAMKYVSSDYKNET